jgi:hypothetical protein
LLGSEPLRARPNPEKLASRRTKEVIFEPESIKILLTHREPILKFVQKEWPNDEEWVDQTLTKLSEEQRVPLNLTKATALASFLAGKKITYWTPSGYWLIENYGKTILDIENQTPRI